jgi:hypothetical protein
MSCPACGSSNQSAFSAEVNIHFRGRESVEHPGVLVFSKLMVCLDCGSSSFTTPEGELSQLAEHPLHTVSTSERRGDEPVQRQRAMLRA